MLCLALFFSRGIAAETLRPDQLNFEGIREFLRANPHIDSVSAFLRTLPPEYKEGVSVVTESNGAIPGVTPSSPRLIFHGHSDKYKDSGFRLLLAANQGSSSLEIIEFKDRKFVPHKIEFPKATSQSRPARAKVRFDDQLHLCYGCHVGRLREGERIDRVTEELSRRFRPNWDPYPNWAGVLPENDRHFTDQEETLVARLRSLGQSDELYSDLPYLWVDTLNDKNNALTNALTIQNAERIAALMETVPHFDEYRVAVLGATMGAPQWSHYLPQARLLTPAGRRAFLREVEERTRAYQERIARSRETLRNKMRLRAKNFYEVGGDFGLNRVERLRLARMYTALSYLTPESDAWISSWSMVFHGYEGPDALPTAFTAGARDLTEYLFQSWLVPLVEKRPELKALATGGTASYTLTDLRFSRPEYWIRQTLRVPAVLRRLGEAAQNRCAGSLAQLGDRLR